MFRDFGSAHDFCSRTKPNSCKYGVVFYIEPTSTESSSIYESVLRMLENVYITYYSI